MERTLTKLGFATAALLAFAACATTPDATRDPDAVADDEPPRIDTGSEFDQGPLLEDETGTFLSGDFVPGLETVYFDFDNYALRADARPILASNAERIIAADLMVTIEGHTDPRGSEEYNLALGELRANMVRKYLQNLGVPGDRLRILSYGEAKRAAAGNDESAWRWDRRAEFRGTRTVP